MSAPAIDEEREVILAPALHPCGAMPMSQADCRALKEDGKCPYLLRFGKLRPGKDDPRMGYECWISIPFTYGRLHDDPVPPFNRARAQSRANLKMTAELYRRAIPDADPATAVRYRATADHLDYYVDKCAGLDFVASQKKGD